MRSAEVPLLPCLVLLMSLGLIAPVSSQVASYVRIADGCPGSQGVPSLLAVADSLPILGEAFSTELSNVPTDGMAVGIIGLSTTNWGAFNLPLDLTSAGLPNCFLHTDLSWTRGLLIAGGTAIWDVTIPSSTEWIGRSFFQQVVVLDPGVGAVMSDAVEAVIGHTPLDVRLDRDQPIAARSQLPQIAASGDTIYVVWQDDRHSEQIFGSFDIYCNRSLDGGVTWLSKDIRLNTDLPGTAAKSRYPQVAASGDTVYVVWQDTRHGAGTIGDIYFSHSSDRGATWPSSDTRLNTNLPGASRSEFPQIAASGDSVYVTWADSRNGSLDIYFNRSLDGGITWLFKDVRLDRDPPGKGWSQFPQVAASGGTVYVVWQDYRMDAHDIYFNRSLDGGADWMVQDIRLDTQDLSEEHDNSTGPQIASSGNAVYVVWRDDRDDLWDIYFNRSLDQGATWLASDLLVDTEMPEKGNSNYQQVAASGGSVYVTWMEQVGSGSSLYFNRSLDGGSSWLDPEQSLDTNLPLLSFDMAPQIAASGESVFVTWSTLRRVLFNRSLDQGDSWLTSDIRMDTARPGGLRSVTPQIVISGDSAYVTWRDNRNHSYLVDVYFNRVPIR